MVFSVHKDCLVCNKEQAQPGQTIGPLTAPDGHEVELHLPLGHIVELQQSLVTEEIPGWSETI